MEPRHARSEVAERRNARSELAKRRHARSDQRAQEQHDEPAFRGSTRNTSQRSEEEEQHVESALSRQEEPDEPARDQPVQIRQPMTNTRVSVSTAREERGMVTTVMTKADHSN